MPDTEVFKKKFNKRIKLLIGAFTVFLIVLMFPKGESIESEISEGSIWIHNDLIASFSFPVLKDPLEYRRELERAKESVYPVFIREEDVVKRIIDSLESYNEFLFKELQRHSPADTNEKINQTFLTETSFDELLNLRYRDRGRGYSIDAFFQHAKAIIINSYSKGILSIRSDKKFNDSIALRIGNIDKIIPVADFVFIDKARESANIQISYLNIPENYKQALIEYADHFIMPTIIYDPQLTNEEVMQAQSNVTKYSGIVNENERIIGKHDRVSKDAKLKIDSYKMAKGEDIGEEGFFLQAIGKYLHISFLLTLLVIYIYLFRKKIFYDNRKILLIAINLLFLCFITFLINHINIPVPLHFLIFIPASSMLISIMFDSRVGFYTTIVFALVTGALRGNDYTFAVMNIFAGALGVYTVRDIKNRSQIFRSFFFILIGYIIAVLAFGLERFASWDSLVMEFAFAGTNALISPVLTYGLLIFFERLFNITTDLTLLELSNFDRPVLKELARKAPGTFNHSMTMGTLAESAAEVIHANPLLARVGAYYHDIGKTITPQNFVENQLNNQNVHENLTPEESINLIIRHVNEGIELAREAKLPQEIIDFIPMHHGTTVISFFYEKAKELYGEKNVNVQDYCYPGPKPNTKESAIVMLADSCESAVRSIEDPDSFKVENVIDKIIKQRIDSGQLNDSPLTFSDISKIKEAFISILLGHHHKRIRYPRQDEMEKGISDQEMK